jgi:hypothetical protein
MGPSRLAIGYANQRRPNLPWPGFANLVQNSMRRYLRAIHPGPLWPELRNPHWRFENWDYPKRLTQGYPLFPGAKQQEFPLKCQRKHGEAQGFPFGERPPRIRKVPPPPKPNRPWLPCKWKSGNRSFLNGPGVEGIILSSRKERQGKVDQNNQENQAWVMALTQGPCLYEIVNIVLLPFETGNFHAST